jgi:hypothetical protein
MAKWSEEFLTEFVELCWKVKSEAYSDRVRKDANLDAVVKKINSILIIWIYFFFSWLRHYATSLKVAGSIPDEIIKFFQFT